MNEVKTLTLKEARIQQGLSQTELSVKANVSLPTVSRAENGHNVSLAVAKSLCEALGVTMEQVSGLALKQRRLG